MMPIQILFILCLALTALAQNDIKLKYINNEEANSSPSEQSPTYHHHESNLFHHSHQNSKHGRPRHGNKLKKQLNNSTMQEQQAQLSNLQRDYLATTVGKDVQIDCKMKNMNHDDDKIVWLKMPKGEVLTLNGNRVTQDARIASKCVNNVSPCWSLVVSSTRESDTGFYVCQTNAMQTKYVYLDIMVPPKLLTQYPIDRIDVNQSMNASITCEFYGKPEPLIKWYKYHNSLPKEIEKFRGFKTINLYIHKDSPSEFECVADNSIPPTVSKKILLNIQYSPQIKFLNSKVFQKRGERVIFDCIVNANPKAKIYWFKNQTRIYESKKYNFETIEETNHRLYINNLAENDFTDYFCTSVNFLGKATSKIELIELRPVVNNAAVDTVARMKSTLESSVTTSSTTTTTTTLSTTTVTTSQTTESTTLSSGHLLPIKKEIELKKMASQQAVIKVPIKDEIIASEEPKTTHKTKIHKLPNYRSNKLSHYNHTKHFRNHKKQHSSNNNQIFYTISTPSPMSSTRSSNPSTGFYNWLEEIGNSASSPSPSTTSRCLRLMAVIVAMIPFL